MSKVEVVVDPEGIEEALKSEAMQRFLQDVCEQKAAELSAQAISNARPFKSSPKLFYATTKRLKHTYVGIIRASRQRRKGSGAEMSIGADIEAKHHIMEW